MHEYIIRGPFSIDLKKLSDRQTRTCEAAADDNVSSFQAKHGSQGHLRILPDIQEMGQTQAQQHNLLDQHHKEPRRQKPANWRWKKIIEYIKYFYSSYWRNVGQNNTVFLGGVL